jgi:hypothetical protein
VFDGPWEGDVWERRLIETAPDHEVATHVAAAVTRLLRSGDGDRYLLEVDANERSISHRLALYLEDEFPGWHVDCEYNRDGHDPKRLQLEPDTVLSDDDQGKTVFPDIIVHKRGQVQNLLAIEIKKDSGESSKHDLEKLAGLRKQLGYTHALSIRFGTGRLAGTAESEWSAE